MTHSREGSECMSIKSKEAYLKKLRMILLFFFKEEEVRSIIYDYEERLEFTQESVNMPDIQHSSLKKYRGGNVGKY